VIGTAVAFFVGFKNNQAYDRMWEPRKIWGGLVNDSRTWGMQIDGYITNTFNKDISSNELKEIKKRLIHKTYCMALHTQKSIIGPNELRAY
jgi:putative membrane protein